MNLAPRRRQSPRVGSLQEIIINSAEEPQPTTTHANEARKKGEKKNCARAMKDEKNRRRILQVVEEGEKTRSKKTKSSSSSGRRGRRRRREKKNVRVFRGKKAKRRVASDGERERERERESVRTLYSISTSPLHHKCYLMNKCMNA